MKTHKHGFFKDGKIFRKGFLEYPDREIGEIRGSEEETMQYFIDRFEIARNKVETLEKQIEEAENKGSYLMKLLHLRKFLSEFDGLGDFVPLYEKLDKLENQLRELISMNRVKNLEIKRALISEAEQAREIEDDREAFDTFDDIRERWIKTGSVEKQYEEEIEGRFSELVQEHFDRKKANYEKRKAEVNERIKKYERIIAMADKLRWERDKRAAIGELKKLQAEWRRLGPIPGMKMKILWRQFKSINDFIFRKGRPDQFQSRRPVVQDNFEESIKKKEQLIFLVDKLRGKTDDETVEEIKRLQRIWSGSGKVPPDKYRQLSNMFFGTCDQILELSFLEKLVRSKDTNYDEKSTQDKIKSKIKILQDLISRDEKELEVFNENFQKVNTNRGSMDKMLNSKLSAKRRKLFVKRKILTQLNESLEKK